MSRQVTPDARSIHLLRAAEHSLARLELAASLVPSPWLTPLFEAREAVLSFALDGEPLALNDIFLARAGLLESPAGLEELSLARTLALAAPAGDLVPKNLAALLGRLRGEATLRALLPDVGAEAERLHPLFAAGLVLVRLLTTRPPTAGVERLGRLLAGVLLERAALLSRPFLCLSLHWTRHRAEHDKLLSAIRAGGPVEPWLGFFLEGVIASAEDGLATVRELVLLVSADQGRVLDSAGHAAVRLFGLLVDRPLLTVQAAAAALSVTKPTAAGALRELLELGILREITGRRRDRTFAYSALLERVESATSSIQTNKNVV